MHYHTVHAKITFKHHVSSLLDNGPYLTLPHVDTCHMAYGWLQVYLFPRNSAHVLHFAYVSCSFLNSYDEKILTDPNRGHWEIRTEADDMHPHKIERQTAIVYRNPLKDIKEGGVVGIDFGTKSTIVVYQDDTTDIMPMRIGTGNLAGDAQEKHLENPTVMEFANIASFLADYASQDGRPHTKWRDITISHDAFDALNDCKSEDYYAFFNDLKQWCGTKDKRIRIKDKQNEIHDLPPFLELGENDFNPIEIYAYYLGLFINNQQNSNGIYLEYLMSFPVTYEKEIRDKVIASFEKGIKKSLPKEILENEEAMEIFSVKAGLSEPAGYAITALKEFGLEPDDGAIFYGVFDFGGGTTDFDFGIYRDADKKKDGRRYHYVVEHFGAQGDRYLGGENILELLAFEVFKKNESAMRSAGISFVLPPECKKFVGSESLLSDSQEARRNTRALMERLRPVWERHEDYEKLLERGTIGLNLYKNSGEQAMNIELAVDQEELEAVIESRIERGVSNFFESLRSALSNENNNAVNYDIDKINIFLSGNSSKSQVVKDLFAKYIAKETEEMGETDKFVLYPPLGTDDTQDRPMTAPTGKTGVAFGIIMGRSSGKIKVVNHNNEESGETKFRYYVGDVDRKDNFEPMLSPDSNYSDWQEFIDAGDKTFEIYYTTSPEASTHKLHITNTKKLKLRIAKQYDDDNVNVYVRPAGPSALEYVVASKIKGEFTPVEEPKQMQLD